MKIISGSILLLFFSCNQSSNQIAVNKDALPLQGTWKLLSGTIIQNHDTTVTDYTKGKSFIKIINATHFAFLAHDLSKGKDTATVFFSSGGGVYKLTDSLYTEHLEYCNDRQWEGNSFNFTVSIHNDTLIQKGIENVDNIGVKRFNTEKYVRIMNP